MTWYVSLTLRWSSLEGDLEPFLDLCRNAEFPSSHIPINERSWHSTLYALARIDRVFAPHNSMHDSALAVLQQFRAKGVTESLSKLAGFALSPARLKVFTNNTTIEFETENEALAKLRSDVSDTISNVAIPFDETDVHFPFNGGDKNSGYKLWGAIARNPAPAESEVLQQEVEIPAFEPSCFRAKSAILTISDDSLTNHFAQGDWDDITLH